MLIRVANLFTTSTESRDVHVLYPLGFAWVPYASHTQVTQIPPVTRRCTSPYTFDNGCTKAEGSMTVMWIMSPLMSTSASESCTLDVLVSCLVWNTSRSSHPSSTAQQTQGAFPGERLPTGLGACGAEPFELADLLAVHIRAIHSKRSLDLALGRVESFKKCYSWNNPLDISTEGSFNPFSRE